MFLRNIGSFHWIFTAPHTRIRHFSVCIVVSDIYAVHNALLYFFKIILKFMLQSAAKFSNGIFLRVTLIKITYTLLS
jgi:hypothetical protein